MKTQEKINLHYKNNEALNLLYFYKDDITILSRRVQEVAAKNTDKEVLAYIEHFQNQLIVQRELVDTFIHDLHEAYKKLDKSSVEAVQDYSEKIKNFEHAFNEMRHELYRFAARWI